MVFIHTDGTYVVSTKSIAAAAKELNKRVDFDNPSDPLTIIFTPMRDYLANMEKRELTAYYFPYVEAMNANLQTGIERFLRTQEHLDPGVRPGLEGILEKLQKIGRIYYDYSQMEPTAQLVRQVINHYDMTLDAMYTAAHRTASSSPTAVTEGENSHTGVMASPSPQRTL